MKKITLQLFILVVFLASCQRQPTANFTTDKTEYQAGDTVHLKNTSKHGKHFIWTMPDGSTQTNNDATYIIPDTTLYSNFIFKLEALSKREKKSDEKSITVLGIIKPKLQIDKYSIDTYQYSLTNKGGGQFNGFWYLYAGTNGSSSNECTLKVYISGNFSANSGGIYNLKSNHNNLTEKEACITMRKFCPDCFPQGSQDNIYTSLSGNLIVNIVNGAPIVMFNNVEARKDSSNNSSKLSGYLLGKL